MPNMSGIQLLRLVRAIDGMQDIPVIVMSSSPHPDTLAACKELNVKAFVEKPVSIQAFSQAIANLFHQPRKGIPA
jgi:CheY-like chemotaxis protein